MTDKTERIGLFGGTFNPIHVGHIELANKIKKELKLDKVIFIPTNIPPHKLASNLESNEHRLKMCQLATQYDDSFIVSDIEQRREGVSYTVDTVKELRQLYPKAELYLLMGDDMFLCFDKWRCYDEILKIVKLAVVMRDSSSLENLIKYKNNIAVPYKGIEIINYRPKTVSSTQIREAISWHKLLSSEKDTEKSKYIKDISCLLPSKVVEYIENNDLYTRKV